ncbi:aldehyde dehydrogenase [Fusarium acutatum]|uniref:Putative aldehyde dehydrogenase FUS7 n=1 Tax=Fusarium acutatum TaxID=78861 RepID=A0A8H4K5S8_9HYPO|nr:aldehyde dehydrogenase [Fusarium acutatum]
MASISATELPKQLFINNAFIDSKSNKTCSVHNPADGSLVADDIQIAGPEDVDAAVDAAEKAFPAWKKTHLEVLKALMLKLADLIDENAEAIILALTTLTLGAPKSITWTIQMSSALLRYFAGWIDKLHGESWPADDGYMKIVRHEPLVVTVGTIPWNAPFPMAIYKASASLAAANCYICKPSEKTPFATLALGSLIKAAGFPPGVFQILTGDGSTGSLLSHHMRVKKVSFTASVPIGKKILAAAAASNLKRDKAVIETVESILQNTGQGCMVCSRVYVQEGIYDNFVEAYRDAMEARAKEFGNVNDPKTRFGPLVDKLQYDQVKGMVDRAFEQGDGKLLTSGNPVGDKGFWFPPTAFIEVAEESEIATKEIFGPVSVIMKFKEEDEVIVRANNSMD